VQTDAVGLSVRPGTHQTRLLLAASGKRVLARLLDPADLVDAEIRLRGVAGALTTGSAEAIGLPEPGRPGPASLSLVSERLAPVEP
jgi:hypothetical protein